MCLVLTEVARRGGYRAGLDHSWEGVIGGGVEERIPLRIGSKDKSQMGLRVVCSGEMPMGDIIKSVFGYFVE